MAGLALVILIMVATHPQAITIRKLKKTKGLLTTGPGNYMASWVRRVESGDTQARSSAFIEVQSGGLYHFYASKVACEILLFSLVHISIIAIS